MHTLDPIAGRITPELPNQNPILRRLKVLATLIALLLLPALALAQGNSLSFAGMQASFPVTGAIQAITIDTAGNRYLLNTTLGSVQKITPQGAMTSVATGLTAMRAIAVDSSANVYVAHGTNVTKYPAGGGASSEIGSSWTAPSSVAVDNSGNVFVIDNGHADAVSSTNVLTTDIDGYYQSSPTLIAADNAGNVYVYESSGTTVVKVSSGVASSWRSAVTNASAMTVDSYGNLYVADNSNNNIRLINPGGSTGYEAARIGTSLGDPTGLAVDAQGTVYSADSVTGAVTKIFPGAVDLGTANVCGVSGTQPTPCSQTATLNFNIIDPTLNIDAANVHVVAQGYVTPEFTTTSTTCSGTLSPGLLTSCSVTVAFTPAAPGARTGEVEIAAQVSSNDAAPPVFRHPSAVRTSRPATTFSANTVLVTQVPIHGMGVASIAAFNTALIYPFPPLTTNDDSYPTSVFISEGMDIFEVDNEDSTVFRLPFGAYTWSPFAGTGYSGFDADGQPGPATRMGGASRAAINGRGDVFIAEPNRAVVRQVDADSGLVATVAGTDLTTGTTGDGGPATLALLTNPVDIAVDAASNLYILDANVCQVRRVDGSTGVITTVVGAAGNAYMCGFSGDGGPATSAQLSSPAAIAVDGAGNLYISDAGNNVIRKVAWDTQIITTVAGSNSGSGYTGDGGQATAATVNNVQGLATDSAGNLYLADTGNSAIRKIDIATGVIRTISGGTPTPGYSGDGGPANAAALNAPSGVSTYFGFVLIADSNNGLVRYVGSQIAPAAFGSWLVGTPSTAIDVLLSNSGNAALNLSALTATAGFDLGGADNTCTTSSPIAPGASCVLGIRFVPTTASSVTGTLTITDDQGNQPGATQTINLTGTGIFGPASKLAFGATLPDVGLGGNLSTVSVLIEGPDNTISAGNNSPVTLTITGPGGFSQTLTVNAVNGTAAFDLSSLAFTTPGVYTATATSGSLTQVTSTFTVTTTPAAPSASQLAFGTAPSSITAGGALGTTTVLLERPDKSVDTANTSTVSLLISGPNGYSQTVTASAVAGVATFDLSSLNLSSVGDYTVTASSGSLTPASAGFSVTPAPTQIVYAAPLPTVTAGGNLGIVQVVLKSANGTVAAGSNSPVTLTITGPGGFSQSFTVNAVTGVASFDLSAQGFTTPGLYTATATSGSLTQAVGTFQVIAAITPDFTIAVTSGTPASTSPILPGQSASYSFTLAPAADSFPGSIALSATGGPAGATYTFTPATVMPGSGSATTQLTVTTAGLSASLAGPLDAFRSRSGGGSALGALTLALLLLPLGSSRRLRQAARRMPLAAIAFALLSLGAAVGLTGCASKGGLFSSPQHTYTITVTGTSGALVHSTQVTLTVQ